MIRSRKIVSESLGAVSAHKYRSGIPHRIEQVERIINTQLEVLGSYLVRNIYRHIYRRRDDYLSVVVDGGARYLAALEQRKLTLYLVAHRLGKLAGVGNKHRACHTVVLRLREQVRRNAYRVASAVGDDEYLARSRYHIYRNGTVNLPLCLSHICISRSDYLVYTRYGLSSVCQRGDSLSAADLKYSVYSGDRCCRENDRRNAAVTTDGGSDNDLAAACDLGRDGIHKNSGRICRRSAGNIQSRTLDGYDLLPYDNALALAYNKAVSLLTLVKLADIVRRLTQNTQKLGLDRFERRIYLLRADGQVVKSGTVKASAVLEQRLVSARTNIGDNIAYRSLGIRARLGARKYLAALDLTVFEYFYHFSFLFSRVISDSFAIISSIASLPNLYADLFAISLALISNISCFTSRSFSRSVAPVSTISTITSDSPSSGAISIEPFR